MAMRRATTKLKLFNLFSDSKDKDTVQVDILVDKLIGKFITENKELTTSLEIDNFKFQFKDDRGAE